MSLRVKFSASRFQFGAQTTDPDRIAGVVLVAEISARGVELWLRDSHELSLTRPRICGAGEALLGAVECSAEVLRGATGRHTEARCSIAAHLQGHASA